MLHYLVTVSALVASILLVRAIFKKSVPQRLIYALWLVVLVRICMPLSLFDLEFTLPMGAGTGSVESEPFLDAYDNLPSLEFPDMSKESLNDAGDDFGSVDRTPPAAPDASVPHGFRIDPAALVYGVWLSGTVIFALTASLSALRMSYRLRKNRTYLRNEGRLRVYLSDEVKTPCLYGLFPAVYIPSDLTDERCVKLTLLHEKTHFCHGDHIWSAVRMAVLALFWWNPLIWAAARLSKKDAELACDESVAKRLSDAERIEYARLIIDNIPEKRSFATGLASAPIKERLLRLTRENKTRWLSVVLAAIIITLSLVFSLTTLSAKAPDAAETPVSSYGYVEGLHYSTLSERGKELYDLFASNLNDPRCVHLELFSDEAAEYDAAYRALSLDNPELAVLTYKHDNVISGDVVTWKMCDAEEDFLTYSSNAMLEDMYAASYEIVSRMPEGLDTAEKYRWLADALCDTVAPISGEKYDFVYTNAGGALVNGLAEASAYAQAYQMLCRDADLWCTTVSSEKNPDAAVNLIRLGEGDYYYMDTASADESGTRDEFYFMEPERLWGRDALLFRLPSGMMTAKSVMLTSEERVNRLPDEMKIARSLLNKNEKSVYDAFEKKILAFEHFNLSFDGIAHEEIANAIEALRHDYPELLIALKSDYIYDSEAGKWSFSISYMKSSNRIDGGDLDAYIKKVIYVADRTVLNMPEGLDTREKYAYLADRLLESVELVDALSGNDERYQHAGGALLNRLANASAVNSAYLLLCQRAGLWCTLAGTQSDGSDTTVLVMLDDGYTYYMDIASAKTNPKENCYFINDDELTALLGTRKSEHFSESALVASAK